MARTRPNFTEADLTRALRAAVKAGISVARLEIEPNGRIVVVTGKATPIEGASLESDLDRELEEDRRRHG